MKLIRGIHNLSQAPHGCVLTIGNFDGVHRGHQALLQGLRKEGEARGLPVVVMISSLSRWSCLQARNPPRG